MGRRPRSKNLDADLDALARELRWRAWMGRVEAVIFASKVTTSTVFEGGLVRFDRIG